MTPRYVVIHKNRGETPLEALGKWQSENPALASLPASYAGRLDPMASGKLLVLLGDECRNKERYTELDKEYEIEVVLDLSTETGDALGLPLYVNVKTFPERTDIHQAIKAMLGTHSVPYPTFSSKTVNGKPLFMYALEGALNTIQIPEHDETIYKVKILKMEQVSVVALRNAVTETLKDVPRSDEPSKAPGADFRQDVIRAGWRALFDHISERKFIVLKLRVTCASGTYMRTLASRIAKELGTDALALSINRTKIGTYGAFGPFHLWTKTY
jgi:tRNA pseudouridine55 synthase